jgi:hypothetical protein
VARHQALRTRTSAGTGRCRVTRLPAPILAAARRADASPAKADPVAAQRVARVILGVLPREAPSVTEQRCAVLAAETQPSPRKAAHA